MTAVISITTEPSSMVLVRHQKVSFHLGHVSLHGNPEILMAFADEWLATFPLSIVTSPSSFSNRFPSLPVIHCLSVGSERVKAWKRHLAKSTFVQGSLVEARLPPPPLPPL